MKKLTIILLVLAALILLFFGAKMIRIISVENKITELRTDHFIISYHGIYKSEAQDIASNLESNYDRIRTNLNDPDHKTIRVFVHPTANDRFS